MWVGGRGRLPLGSLAVGIKEGELDVGFASFLHPLSVVVELGDECGVCGERWVGGLG